MGGVYNPFNLNTYAYSHQNPVKYVDPDGESPRIVRWLGNSPLGRWLANTPVGKKTIKGFKKFNKGVDKALQSTWEGAKALWRWAGDKLSGSGSQISGKGFKSFSALKKHLGPAGKGREWHHIVEQRLSKKFGDANIHNTKNIINLDKKTHKDISRFYSSKVPEISGNKTIRKWLEGQSFEKQHKFGMKTVDKALKGKLSNQRKK